MLQASSDGNVYNYVLTNLNRTVAIDFDINEGLMYWADVIDNTIYRTSITFDQGGSHPSEVSNISNTRKSVSSDIQTLRSGLKKRGAAEFF